MSSKPDRASPPTWRSIAIAVGVVVGLLGLVCVTALAIAFHQHTAATVVSRETADQIFARERVRFGDARPMIIMGSHGAAVVHRAPASAPLHQLNALHALAYDPRTGKLVRTDVPNWLLEVVSAGGWLRLANMDFTGSEGRVTLDDLKRYGPGLLLSYEDSNGSRMLVWTD
ncbi:MAG TPA: hypothetical protein VND92_11095 [Vicinamibacterales bacterium]|nr:hypothetical protein [Vicinamibacterales bacterium]